jgi:hypothetical protein
VTGLPVVPRADADGEKGGEIIAEVVLAELESARVAANSVQSRGLAVISTAGTLVTLLFGLSALVTKAQDFVLPSAATWPLSLAAVLLVLAAMAGLVTNAPRRSDVMKLSALHPLVEGDLWHVPAFHAKQEIARTRLAMAENARTLNQRMARFLAAAIGLEIAGVACVGWAVISVLVGT